MFEYVVYRACCLFDNNDIPDGDLSEVKQLLFKSLISETAVNDSISNCNIISFNDPCVCRIELSNPSCFTAVCKPGSVEFTGTVRQRGLESSLRHTQGDCFFLYYTFVSFL